MQFRAIDVLIYPSDLVNLVKTSTQPTVVIVIKYASSVVVALYFVDIHFGLFGFVYGHGIQFRAIDLLLYPRGLVSVLFAYHSFHNSTFTYFRNYNFLCVFISL
jgi:hypothetical protein